MDDTKAASCLGIHPIKPKLGQIQSVDKNVNHPNRIVLADPVLQAFRKQRALPAIRALNKSLHPIPRNLRRNYRENQIKQCVFTQPRSFATEPSRANSGQCPLLPQ